MDKDVRKKEAFWKVETEGQTDRVRRLNAKRDRQRQEFEEALARRNNETAGTQVLHINEQFQRRTSHVEQVFTEVTTGLVSPQEYKERRELLQKIADEEVQRQLLEEGKAAERHKEKKRRVDTAVLSFGEDAEEEEAGGEPEPAKKNTPSEPMNTTGENAAASSSPSSSIPIDAEADGSPTDGAQAGGGDRRKFGLGKDPSVDTSFLKDAAREADEARLKEQLAAEWHAEQEKIKKETMTVTYSYWDGKGNRRQVKVEKGWTIARFLTEVQREFRELARMSVDNLMFIKEDLIIPQHLTFYDLIITKARGKSGPLFQFDVKDDVRLVADTRQERVDTHAGKVVERKWYERNRHIFPASRWEPYDPNKSYGTVYTVKGPGK